MRNLKIACVVLLAFTGKVFAAPTTLPVDDVRELQQLIGKSLDSDDVQQLLKRLPHQNFPTDLRKPGFASNRDAGLEVSFTGAPRCVSAIFLHGEGDQEFHRYEGPLPVDLQFGETRGAIEKQLGPPDWTHGTGAYPELGLFLEYAKHVLRDPINPLARITMIAPDPAAAKRTNQPRPRLEFRLVSAGDDGTADEMVDPLDPTGSTKLRVLRDVLLDASSIEDLSLAPLNDNRPPDLGIAVQLTDAGAQKLAIISKANIGRRIAIVLDDHVLIAPQINAQMSKNLMITRGKIATREQMIRTLRGMFAAVDSLPVDESSTQPAK